MLLVLVAPKEFIVILCLEDSNNVVFVINVTFLDILVHRGKFFHLPGQMFRHVESNCFLTSIA